METFTKSLPISLPSPNVKEHWARINRRNQANAMLIKHYMLEDIKKVTLPCRIILERRGKRLYDDDNNIFSFKGIRDSLAQFLFGKKRGVGDNDPRIEWVYRQSVGEISLIITFEWGENGGERL